MYSFSKRLFDFSLAFALLPFAIAICFPFGALFSLTTGEFPVFRQWRVGLNGKRFRIWKLRTMRESRCSNGKLLPDDERLTALGWFLRKSSIDEMPQLVNILMNDMSFVGPRPQIDEFLKAMTDEEKRRHDLIPGITGWAQINGRNAMGWSERFSLDLWYVNNASFSLDLQILLRTPLAILGGVGVSREGHVSMPTIFEERPNGNISLTPDGGVGPR